MKCLEECKLKKTACKQKDCRMWVNYSKDFNCCLESIDKNGAMTLRQTADRLGISFVRVKQIESKILKKLYKLEMKE